MCVHAYLCLSASLSVFVYVFLCPSVRMRASGTRVRERGHAGTAGEQNSWQQHCILGPSQRLWTSVQCSCPPSSPSPLFSTGSLLPLPQSLCKRAVEPGQAGAIFSHSLLPSTNWLQGHMAAWPNQRENPSNRL